MNNDNVLLRSPQGMIVTVLRDRYEARKQTTFKFYEIITDEDEISQYFDLEQTAVDAAKEDSAQADQPAPRKKKAAKAQIEPPQVD